MRCRVSIFRDRGKSNGEDLNIDDEGPEQNVEPLQSLHYSSDGYQSVHTRIELTKKANPRKHNREHKQKLRRSNLNYV
jgi:hypothetical protein